ncbi:MAG: hypothetical protein RLZZ28_2366, partial [Bacteroidota bacterium]
MRTGRDSNPSRVLGTVRCRYCDEVILAQFKNAKS